ncbi:hypothetical protein FRX31_033357, partial [Thalictrum thalictroides]
GEQVTSVCRERVVDLCSSEQELSDLHIQARQYKPCTIYQGYGKVCKDMAKHTEINSQLKLLSVRESTMIFLAVLLRKRRSFEK